MSGTQGAWSLRAPELDVRFVLDLAVRMRWDARTRDPEGSSGMMRAQIGSGTLDAALWVLGVTSWCPTSGELRLDRSPDAVMLEAVLAEHLRAQAEPGSPESFYMGAVADALDFALGEVKRFWWVPVPEWLRQGRDEYGRAVA